MISYMRSLAGSPFSGTKNPVSYLSRDDKKYAVKVFNESVCFYLFMPMTMLVIMSRLEVAVLTCRTGVAVG